MAEASMVHGGSFSGKHEPNAVEVMNAHREVDTWPQKECCESIPSNTK